MTLLRRLRLLRGLLLVCFVFAGLGAAVAEQTITIATLNCEFLILSKVHVKFGLPLNLAAGSPERTRWSDDDFRQERFADASQAIAKVIARINADLIGLCEVGDADDVEALVDAVANEGVEYEQVAVGVSSDKTTGQHVAILCKHSLASEPTIPGRETYFTELDDDEEAENDTGVSKGLHVTMQGISRPIHVYLAHLASERLGHEQDAQRLAQASIVRRNYLTPLNRGEHVVVMGDFNAGRTKPVLRRIRGMDDIWEDLIQPAGPVFNKKRSSESSEDFNERLANHWTYEFNGRREQIDHILLSNSIRDACKRSGVTVEFVDVTETIGDTDHLATDHRGVIVRLTIP